MNKISKSRINNLSEFESNINYKFNNIQYLDHALTHKSYANELNLGYQNERYELLGDAILELVISEYIFFEYPEITEGEIAKIRASVVSAKVLYKLSNNINTGKYMLLGKGEELTGGRERPSILADAFEAIICAIYFDGGIEKAKDFILTNLKDKVVESKGKFIDDYKTALQELTQDHFKQLPKYSLINETGPAHDRFFEIAVYINEHKYGQGSGKSKKKAEQLAAEEAYNFFKNKIDE